MLPQRQMFVLGAGNQTVHFYYSYVSCKKEKPKQHNFTGNIFTLMATQLLHYIFMIKFDLDT